MARDEKLELLKRIQLFSRLNSRELLRLGELADEVDLPGGRVLMREGERGEEAFVIVSGSAAIERDGRVVANRSAGEILGEIALVDGGPRTATVRLAEDSRLIVLGRKQFQSLMDEYPDVRLRILETLAQRVRATEPDAAH
jgi:CRP/FNR family transcriptional regulator, cyclic AMP receptor protein